MFQVAYRDNKGTVVTESEHETLEAAMNRLGDFDSSFYTLFVVEVRKLSDAFGGGGVVNVVFPDDPDGFGIPKNEQVYVGDIPTSEMTDADRAFIRDRVDVDVPLLSGAEMKALILKKTQS